MSDFKAAYTNELIKMQRKSRLIAGGVVSLVATIIYQLIISLVSSGMGVRIGSGPSFALSVLSFYTATLLPLFAVFVVIDCFNGEYAANTMKQTLVRPLTRLQIYGSKVAAVGTFVGGSLLFMLLLSSTIAFIASPASFSFGGLGSVFIAYLVTWLPMMVFILLVILLAQFSSNGILTFFCAVATYIGLYVTRFFAPHLANLLVVPLFDWYVGWIAHNGSFTILLRQGLLLLSSGMVFFALGCRLFEGKNM
ncbi:MAG: ABC transporter permease [Symbiobacteriaceae bacterium]|nr:ABC transporter permease [Symbiobacteriaceae bacterium]